MIHLVKEPQNRRTKNRRTKNKGSEVENREPQNRRTAEPQNRRTKNKGSEVEVKNREPRTENSKLKTQNSGPTLHHLLVLITRMVACLALVGAFN